MILLQLIDIKEFMSHLLLKDTFDHFYLKEASITTFSTFLIDGYLQKEYFSSEEQEMNRLETQPYCYWQQVRSFCFDLIKGKKTPLSFKLVFQLSSENTAKLLAQSGLSLSPSDVSGLYLNLHYDGEHLNCVTGTSLRIFTLDKSLDQAWDLMVQKFLRSKQIPFER